MKIFVSYRRADSADITGRICDRLIAQFGKSAIFIDIDSIPPGVDFREHLKAAVVQCNVLLAIIGPRWQETAAGGASDFVRIEIKSAFARKIPVVPVLVGGASMPSHDSLPKDLAALSFLNAAVVHSGQDFHDHVTRLMRGLESWSGSVDTTPKSKASKPSQSHDAVAKPKIETAKPKEPPAPSRQPFVLEIADSFFITGRGAVATGVVKTGTCRVGDEVIILRGDVEVQRSIITGVEMFKKLVDVASSGDNVGLLLRGVAKGELERGMLIVSPK